MTRGELRAGARALLAALLIGALWSIAHPDMSTLAAGVIGGLCGGIGYFAFREDDR